MKVLVVGSGGREHALSWKLAKSPHVTSLYAAPGNPGIATVARCVGIPAESIGQLAAFAQRERIDVTIVGPELPLTLGIVDTFAARDLPVFGPTRAASALEGSKVFAKRIFARRGIPTAPFEVFEDAANARRFVRALDGRVVVKADGLAAGKGVVVCDGIPAADAAIAGMLEARIFGDAGSRIVIEERLDGEELSFFALTDGKRICPLAAAQDHKAVLDEDRGPSPNTGGMGAWSAPALEDQELARRIVETIIRPTVDAMAAEGRPYRGVLYAGLMLTGDGPKVLEYNARFGDPECQVLMSRLADDLLPLVRGVADGSGLPESAAWCREAAVCVVLASAGYPGSYETGHEIHGIEAAAGRPGVTVFHAGTARKEGRLVTAGGRVLGVTALGGDVSAAIAAAYDAVGLIQFEGMHFRRDIGRRALAPPGKAG